MAISRTQKAAQLKDLTEKLRASTSLMFAHYIGLNVTDVSELRRKLKGAKAEMKVAKKTLMHLAAKEAGLPDVEETMLTGPVAYILSFSDPLTGAQVAFAFSKDHPQISLIGGIFEGKLLSREEAIAFAKIPGREPLLGIFASMLRSPLQNFASICSSPLSNFTRAVDAWARKKTAS